jgi:Leucine-rich repeat (LRR) protein
MSANLLYRQFGCDAILCPAGTFHPFGAATLQSGCRPCPLSNVDDTSDPPLNKVLGRIDCPGASFVHGDLNGDGKLSQREILRLVYSYNIGMHWGAQFQTWADPKINECDLNGVVCVNGQVAKIDLTDAAVCTNGERKAGPIKECRGLPSELSLLTQLEVLILNRRQFLRGTLPTELGRLSMLKYLDISSCPSLTGPLPSELGRLTSLKYLNVGGCRFNETVPDELYNLTHLEKLHLSMNSFTGTVSTKIGQLTRLKELIWSRTQMSGTIPNEIGEATGIENLEMYGNQFDGEIPPSLGNCSSLKRIGKLWHMLGDTILSSVL